MGVEKVSSTPTYTPPVSNRNPANKKELMASYQQQRNIQKSATTQAIISAVTGNKGTVPLMAPNIPQAPVNQGPLTPLGPGQLERIEATVVKAPGNKNNVIKGPEGFASSGNRVVVNGADNTVDLSRSAPTHANINVTGGGNAVKFNGGMQDNTTVNLNGNGNAVNVGRNVDRANVNVAGSNVTVNLADNNPLIKNQNNWNVIVSANDVNISVENGQAKVTGANGNQNFKAEIDNKSRTVTVTELPNRNAGGQAPPTPGEDLGVGS